MIKNNEIIDDLLCKWHVWEDNFRIEHGFQRTSTIFRKARSSRGFDTIDDIIFDEIENQTMEIISFAVHEMKEPHRSAIYCLARNLCVGCNVWSSPRLPKDEKILKNLIIEARNMLEIILEKAGVLIH